MHTYRPDRAARALSGIATVLYFLTWVFAVVSLVWMPVARVLAARGYEPAGWSLVFGASGLAASTDPDGRFLVAAPVRLVRPPASWRTESGGRVEVSEVRATASAPMSSLSPGFVALVWVSCGVLLGLVLLFLRELRRLFSRLRAGAPFDPGNASRLRRLGLLLLGAGVWIGITNFWMSVAIARKVEEPGTDLGTGLYLNLPAVFVALVLIALAEIFRRGAALEEEQSLVV